MTTTDSLPHRNTRRSSLSRARFATPRTPRENIEISPPCERDIRAAAARAGMAAPVEVRPAADSPSAKADWAAYVATRRDATIFHELPWQQAVARAFGHRPHNLVARRAGAIVGVLPLVDLHSVVAGRLLVSMPYATYGGILADDPTAARALFESAMALARRISARRLELRSISAAVPEYPTTESHATFQRELPHRPADTPGFLPRKARAAARQAESRYALTTTFDSDQLDAAWQLYSRSMRRLASPNYPRRFFHALRSQLGDDLLVQLVRHDGAPVAALVSLCHRHTIMPYFLGLDDRARLYGLSHYVYRRCIEWAVEHGYRRFDFGRSRRDNAGASDFKRHCGFEPTVLQYQAYSPPGTTPPDLSPTAARWTVARSMWRRLPLAVTRPLGGWVAKSIPG